MKPFTKIVYFHQRTPKVLKKGIHNCLFYNSPLCIKYKCNNQYVTAEYKKPYDVAKILKITARDYINIRFIKDTNYRMHYKNYLKVHSPRKPEIEHIIKDYHGEIIQQKSRSLIVKFNSFFNSAKVMDILEERNEGPHIKTEFAKRTTIKTLIENTMFFNAINNCMTKH